MGNKDDLAAKKLFWGSRCVSSAIDGVEVGGTLESHHVGEKDDFRTLAAGSKYCR